MFSVKDRVSLGLMADVPIKLQVMMPLALRAAIERQADAEMVSVSQLVRRWAKSLADKHAAEDVATGEPTKSVARSGRPKLQTHANGAPVLVEVPVEHRTIKL